MMKAEGGEMLRRSKGAIKEVEKNGKRKGRSKTDKRNLQREGKRVREQLGNQ